MRLQAANCAKHGGCSGSGVSSAALTGLMAIVLSIIVSMYDVPNLLLMSLIILTTEIVLVASARRENREPLAWPQTR